MNLIEVKSTTPGRLVNIGRNSYEFGKDCLALIPENEAVELESNPNYTATGKTSKFQQEEETIVEVKKVVVKEKQVKKVTPKKVDVSKKSKTPAKG